MDKPYCKCCKHYNKNRKKENLCYCTEYEAYVMQDNVKLIESEFGLIGFAVIIKMYQKIYGSEGYYCNWNSDIGLLFAKEIGLRASTLSEIINACLNRGIFDRGMYEKYSVLTSHGIQARYFDTAKRRKFSNLPYLLYKCAQKSENADNSSKNVDISAYEAYVDAHHTCEMFTAPNVSMGKILAFGGPVSGEERENNDKHPT